MVSPKLISSLCLLLLATSTKCDDAKAEAVSSSGSGGIATPPQPQPVPPPVGAGGIPGGIVPGLGGLGFNKHLDFNAGFGPFLGGLGGLGALGGLGGGVPVPPPDAGIGGGGFGIPGNPFGLLGPSYIPSTWIGSALGAKGDLLFPLVIFVFFIVGLWTIVQFLLGLIVPLIAAKMSVLKGGLDKKFRRALTPQEDKDEQISHLTNVVWAAFENFGCMKTSACYTGNMIHSLAGPDKVKQYDGLMETMKIMDKDIVAIFKKSVESGKEDCSRYPCEAFEKDANKGKNHNQGSNDV